MPRSLARRASRRVSSAATMSAVDNASRCRREASPTLPSGAPTRISRPAMSRSPIRCPRPPPRRSRSSLAQPIMRCARTPYAAPAAYDRRVSSAPLTDDVRALAAARDTDDAPRAAVPEIVRRRLAPRMPDDNVFSWIGTAVVVAIAGIIRLVGLSHPPGKIFDEIYYATEGNDLFRHGVEWNATQNSGDFVVHPPLGKWLIGTGEWFFHRPRHLGVWWEVLLLVGIAVVAVGLARLTRRVAMWSSLGALAIGLTALTVWAVGRFEPQTFGWRIMPAIFGTLAILITIRLGRRMFRSTVLGLAAGLLMALDGMEFVLSRTALLDIFLMFFILAAFACLVMDRDQRRRRWLTALESGIDPTRHGRNSRPRFSWRTGIPWWRIAGAVMTGCAMSVKWSALWYVILFVALIFVWEVGAR